jgi:AcrR family transcriptional regulator
MQDEKRLKVRKAAMEVFLRHGYRKVTMDDIAKGVGVSRPALYLVFPNKEAVFRDLVMVGLDDLLAAMENGLVDKRTIPEQLAHVFEVSTVQSFEMVARSPAAAELMHASFDFVQDLFDRFEQRRADILCRIIRSAVAAPDALRPSAQARAHVMVAAAHGFKHAAKDAQEMRAWVNDLIQMTVAGLPLASGGSRRNSGAERRKGQRRG